MKCAVATENGFVVLDWSGNGRIHWVDREGVVTHTYGQGDDEGLVYPWQLASDSHGRPIVADESNNRLHLVDANRRLSCYLLTRDSGLQKPLSLWLDEATSLLYVTQRPGSYSDPREIRVYTWPTAALPTAVNTSHTQHTLQVKVAKYN